MWGPFSEQVTRRQSSLGLVPVGPSIRKPYARTRDVSGRFWLLTVASLRIFTLTMRGILYGNNDGAGLTGRSLGYGERKSARPLDARRNPEIARRVPTDLHGRFRAARAIPLADRPELEQRRSCDYGKTK